MELRIRPAEHGDTVWITALAPRMHEFGPPPWRDARVMNDAVAAQWARELANPTPVLAAVSPAGSVADDSGIGAPGRVRLYLPALMLVQSSLGLLFQRAYRDPGWIRAAWFANDWVTLVVAVPLFVAAAWRVRRGSVRGQLLWCGLLAYAAYNYCYYLLGAALNAFFPLYVALLLLAAWKLGLTLRRLDGQVVASSARASTTVKVVASYFVVVAVVLSAVWLATWAGYVFAGKRTPVEPEAFKLVAGLDLTLMVPALGTGGVLLWRRRPWGFVLATIAGVQATLYLLVLMVGSAVAIARGLAPAPGELPVWGTLMMLTGTATVFLLANVAQTDLDSAPRGG